MKRVLGCVLVGCCLVMMALPCMAQPAKIGIGINVQENGGALYLPVRMERFMIEPILVYRNTERERSLQGGNTRESYKEREEGLGMGGYLIQGLRDKVDLLVGVQFLYLDYKETTVTTTGINTRTEMDGVEIAPSLGIEYALSDWVSLGGYVRLAIQAFSGEYTTGSRGTRPAGFQRTGGDIRRRATVPVHPG